MYRKFAGVFIVALIYAATTNAADIRGDEPGTETGVLALEKDQFDGWVNGKIDPLQVDKVAKNQYKALPDQPIVGIPPQPVDCWALYDKYMADNKSYFQAYANKYCRNYMGCWCCPNGGLCVAFFVKPNSFRCKWQIPAYQQQVRVFEPYLTADGK